MVAGSSSSDEAKIGGITPDGVQLQRQVRRVALEHAVADLALGILDQQSALRALEEHDGRNHHHGQNHDRQDNAHRRRAGAALFQGLHKVRRQAGDDAGEDDQRNAVADAASGDLLAKPHQEHRAAGQRDNRGNTEEQARIDDDAAARSQGSRKCRRPEPAPEAPCRSGCTG